MDASQVMIESLEEADIEYVFGLPGSVIMNTIDKVIDTDLQFISTRHEQTATTMADGYARVTGRPGVTLAHVGPGTANQVLGVAAAYRDNSPVVAIGGNEDLKRLGRNIWHEWDVDRVFEPITKWQTQLHRGDDAARTMRKALVKSVSGTPGPVFLDLPKDVSREESTFPDADQRFYEEQDVQVPFERPAPTDDRVDAVINLIQDADRPLFLAGGGCVWSGASEILTEVVELLGVPVVTSDSGRGIVPETHSNSLGIVGTRGTETANAVVETADLIVGVGARFSDTTTQDWTLIDPSDTRLVQIDISPDEFAAQYPIDVTVQSDVREFLEALHERVATSEKRAWEDSEIASVAEDVREEVDEFFEYEPGDQISANHFFAAVREQKDDDAIITQGGGVHSTFNTKQPAADEFSHLHTISFGGMGYGFPMALGAKLGCPDRQVICIEGDGGFAMVMQDLETAVRYDIGVNVIIYNNFSHGTQKLRQARLFGERYLGTDVDNPDFGQIARDFGAYGEQIEDPDEFAPALRRTFDHDGPSLLDVIVDPADWPGTDKIADI